MSKLEKLISEICPNGVEYKAFYEFGTMIRGNGLQKKDFTEKGIGCIHYGQIYTYYGTSTSETKTFVSEELANKLRKVNTGDLIIAITSENVEDVCKCVAWLGDDEIVTGGHSAIFKHNQDPKYLSYYFQTADFFSQKRKIANGTKVIEISAKKLEQIRIPIPPLPVQREIVRILDNFKDLTAELTAKLTAEFTARKQQYDYYRNKLLTFDTDKVEFVALGDICNISRGRVISKDFIRENQGEFPVYSSQTENDGALGTISTFDYEGEYLTWTTDGANAGFVFYRNGKFSITNVCGLLKPKNKHISIRYLYFVLGITASKYVSKGMGNPKLMSNTMAKIKVQIPPIQEQQRIVKILDIFDSQFNDLTNSLPAEIEARKKQYEYYRDELLAFKECEK